MVYNTKKPYKNIQTTDFTDFRKFKTFCRGQKGYAETTIEETLRKLRYIERYGVDLNDFTDDDFYEFLSGMKQDGMRSSGLNHYIKSINRWCEFKGLPYHFKKFKEYNKEPEILSDEEVRRLINFYSEKTPTHKRNKLLILFLARTGIRNRECCNIRLKDIDWTHSKIDIWGKGGGMQKPRTIPIDFKLLMGKTYPSLKNYVDHWRLDTDDEFLFTTQSGKLTTNRLRVIVKEAANAVGLPWVHPHSFRHYFATSVYNATKDLLKVSKYLGHENIETTARYLHLIDGDLRKLINHPNVKDPLMQRLPKNGGCLANSSEEVSMGPLGFEPRTSAMSRRRHNQLDQGPVVCR